MAADPGPPRPIAPGDVVVAFSDVLGEWTGAQITHLEREGGVGWASVLALDWSGPEPTSIDDLGPLTPLRITHHSWEGQLWHVQYEWLLPRGARVLGNAPLLHDEQASIYAGEWTFGAQLNHQRRWDINDTAEDPNNQRFEGAEVPRLVDRSECFPDVWGVMITDIDTLDAADVVALFPNLTGLDLYGDLGSLTNAGELNRLSRLKSLELSGLFDMTASDCLRVAQVPELEWLELHSVPAEYARAMRREWAPEKENGTRLQITGARQPGWVAENRDNPLRDWDGRELISAAAYRKSVAQYRLTRRAVLDQLAEGGEESAALTNLGREFAGAFNDLDDAHGFIETDERQELFAALESIVRFCEQSLGRTFDTAASALSVGAQDVRAW